MPTLTSNTFFESLEKSGVLAPDALEKARASTEGLDGAKAIARWLIKDGVLTRWQANMLLNGKTKLQLGKYRLIEQIASGGLGHVFLANHTQMDRRVVLRTLARVHTQNPKAIKQFLGDARKIASLDHRNLIHVFDVDSDGDRYYLVTEYSDGRDLLRLLKKKGGPLSPKRAVEIVRQAAEGLAHAHAAGVVHGAIRPENILVDDDWNVKVTDIGVAALADEHAGGSDSNVFCAPELAAGGDLDPRAAAQDQARDDGG